MKMSVPAMGPTTDFKQWKRTFLNFLSIKASYFIPQLAIRDSGVWLDEPAQHYAYTLLLHAASANQRADQAMKCVSPARLDRAAAAWDILCERLDCRSFARSLSLLENLMGRQPLGQSLSDYVQSMRQTFDDYNETCQMVDGSAAIHPHNLGPLMMRGISSSGPHGQAKQSVINAFDTNYLLSADEVMASILHLAHNMDDEPAPDTPAPVASPPPISAFVTAGRGSQSGQSQPHRHPRGSLPNKCVACGSLNHLMSACTATDDAILKWNLAKRMLTVQKYGAAGGTTSAHAALLSDVPADDAPADGTDSLPTLEDCADDYDDNEVSVPFSSVAFSSSLAPCRNLSHF
jgi:hypothetical protein